MDDPALERRRRDRLPRDRPSRRADADRRPGRRSSARRSRPSRSACRRPARSSRSTTAPVSAIAETQLRDAVDARPRAGRRIDRHRGRRRRRHRPDRQLPGRRDGRADRDPRSPTSSRRWSSASRSRRPAPSSRRTARSSSTSRRTGPARSRASRAGSTLTIDQAVPIETPVAARGDAASTAPTSASPARDALLGIDLGERRIGLAIADDDGIGRSAAFAPCDAAATSRPMPRRSPPSSRRRGSTRWSSACRSRRRATRARRPTLTRAWGEAIRDRLGLPVSFRDERLSSHLAEDSARADETRTFRRPAEQDPARCLSGPGRSRGRRDHPPG